MSDSTADERAYKKLAHLNAYLVKHFPRSHGISMKTTEIGFTCVVKANGTEISGSGPTREMAVDEAGERMHARLDVIDRD